jgi:hypothetical protein
MSKPATSTSATERMVVRRVHRGPLDPPERLRLGHPALGHQHTHGPLDLVLRASSRWYRPRRARQDR